MEAAVAAQLALFDKRWLRREERWRAPPELFDPTGFGVERIPEREARAIVVEHHYSGTFPAARLSVGLVRRTPCTRELLGVAVFSVPMNQHAITANAGVAAEAGVELGRFVCLPDIAFNGESWFLRRAFQCLRAEKPEVQAVLSDADPVERRTAEGRLCKPAHAGTIYQATSAAFIGRATPHWLWLARDGRVISPRALAKIRAQHRGHRYAEAQLLAAGAEERRHGEEPAAWLERVLREPLFQRLRHPGNFVYVFGLDRAARDRALSNALPYPRLRARPPCPATTPRMPADQYPEPRCAWR
jgi:hypothetical protein